MDQKRIPAGGLQPGEKAVLSALQLAGHGEKTGRFAKDQDLRVFVHEVQRGVGGEVVKIRDERGVRQSRGRLPLGGREGAGCGQGQPHSSRRG